MDYKYINQLLDRYFACETSLEEENILRTFFSQTDVPAEFSKYRDLFAYQHEEVKNNILSDDFDERILAMTENNEHVKARTIKMSQRFMPLFKAVAVVAIILTLGNAMQVPFNRSAEQKLNNMAAVITDSTKEGVSVAMTDSSVIDSMQQSNLNGTESPKTVILK